MPHHVALAEILPTQIPSLLIADRSLGETESTRARIGSILHYDDVVQRSYRGSGWECLVYAVYWKPGSASVFEPEEHTPDVCWVQVNWRKEIEDNHYHLPAHSRPLRAGRYREYTMAGARQYVVFWHLAGGELYERADIPLGGALLGAWRMRGASRGEQLLVRLSSDVPFSRLQDEPGFRALVNALGQLGLYYPTAEGHP